MTKQECREIMQIGEKQFWGRVLNPRLMEAIDYAESQGWASPRDCQAAREFRDVYFGTADAGKLYEKYSDRYNPFWNIAYGKGLE